MLDFISSQVENQPEIFGPLHFIVSGVFVVLLILTCVFLRKTNEKQNKIILLFLGFWLLLFEGLKQSVLIHESSVNGYQWQHLVNNKCK